MPNPTAVQLIGTTVLSWALWKLARGLTKKDPFANLRGPPSSSILMGSIGDMISTRGWEFHKQIGEEYGGVQKMNGFLGDQEVYEAPDHFTLGNETVFGKGLLSTLGEYHRKQRKALGPLFSVAHMREMVPIFYDVVNKLGTAFEHKVENGPATFDVLHWMTRTALELIGQGGVGYSFDTLTEDSKEHPFSSSLKRLIPAVQKVGFFRMIILPQISRTGPAWLRRAGANILGALWPNFQRVKDIVDVMSHTSEIIFEAKKEALRLGPEVLESQVGRGKDIITGLLKANMTAAEEDRLPDEELLGQISTLTFAGMDTTSNTMARIFYELTQHPEAQEKLRQEITEAQAKHGELGYNELLNHLPYLDAVCRETLRLYAPAPLAFRVARQDMMLPVSKPLVGVNGEPISEVFVPKGTHIFIAALQSNRNPEVWGPDSYEWKPERWLSPLPDSLVDAKVPGVYSHLMTFIGGGRACLGYKFAELEMKIILAVLIPKFSFALPKGTQIFWPMGGIATPIVDENNPLETALPLVVSAV
ncbi:hypothetical protein D9611_008461 [Ephemerocybe angulata]|uniref:Cytochrome P450 n=1 Tax=Ephemerocybe angulata TaxID=980116 RepID=A0A8H5AYY4_9AGAR|nr:hypothetical protein D9611_008461 [Tulosesus angulatus]